MAAAPPLVGTYKSNLFAAVSSREEWALTVGVMWWTTPPVGHVLDPRHATTEDGMGSYSWTVHDGRRVAEQTLVDSKMGVALNMSVVFAGSEGAHAAPGLSATSVAISIDHLASRTRTRPPISFVVYVSSPDGSAALSPDSAARARVSGLPWSETHTVVRAASPAMPDVAVVLAPAAFEHPPRPQNAKKLKARNPGVLSVAHYSVPRGDAWRVHDLVKADLRASAVATLEAAARLADAKAARSGRPNKVPTSANSIPFPAGVIPAISPARSRPAAANVVALQGAAAGAMTLEFGVVSGAGVGQASDAEVAAAAEEAGVFGGERAARFAAEVAAFEARFEATYGLAAAGYAAHYVRTAQAALSNLVGGLSYFYGASLVSGAPGGGGRPAYGEAHGLLTCVPSRSFFPRGFLWDEGFHQLVMASWDEGLARDVLSSWLGAMDGDGWIAREQILGAEAESRVPSEFVTQYKSYANPPTLLLPIAAMAERAAAAVAEDGWVGVESGDGATMAFLERVYPALARQFAWFEATQGGSVPGTYRWRGRTPNHTLTSGLDDYPRSDEPSVFEKHVDLASWMVLAARLLASTASKLGKVDEATAYAQHGEELLATLHATHWVEGLGAYADTGARPGLGPTDEGAIEALGYISLFPLLTGLLDDDDARIGALLAHLEDPDTLWSVAGIRSLAKTDARYGKGENYWRGPVWININYLVLAGLNKVAGGSGPYAGDAARIYAALRANVVDTVVSNYATTGYFWEQYHPETGHGQRTHPFAGWTTLVVLIMAEQYPY